MSSSCRLYLVSPPKLSPSNFAEVLKGALAGGDVASFQLRLKDMDDDHIRRAVDVLRPIVQGAGVAFLLNDRPDLAVELGCDGVHVGQEDAPYAEARRLLGPDRIVGVTCHDSRHLAMEAAEAGADYVAFGAFFPTETKQPKASAGIELLSWWSEMMVVPVVAIGGITVANAPPLVAAGADFLAVSAGVWDYADGPEAAVAAFNGLFREQLTHMHHNLLVFAFCAILLGFAYHFTFAEIYEHYFAASVAFQTYWYVPFIIVPAVLQTALGWMIGFWRAKTFNWTDGAAALIVAAVVYLNLDASYACGSGVFRAIHQTGLETWVLPSVPR